MTLLITALAAVACTVIWYKSESARELKTGILCWMFWGAFLMWLGDAIFEYMDLGEKYFTPAPEDMLNDFFLGLSVVAFALIIWVAVLLIKDPKGVVKSYLIKKA